MNRHGRHQKLVRDIIEAMQHMVKSKDVTPEISDDAERPNEAFHADNHIQNECMQQYGSFKKSVQGLGHRLDDFIRAKRMTVLLDVFRQNSISIYKAFGENDSPEQPDIFHSNSPHRTQKPFQQLKELTDLLENISEELGNFLKSLSDIPEFSDKKLTDSILAFEGWLIYRTGNLEDFRGQPQTHAMERYTNHLMLEMCKYMTETGKALENFARDGVVAIKEAQDRSKEQLLNMSTVATFFSGVAATTFQYTAGEQQYVILHYTKDYVLIFLLCPPSSHLDQAVRALLVSSLILSIASAINSQLAMHWRSAMYRSPRSALPMWTSVCLNHTPLLFLVAAVLTFSVGLVGYTYSSSQGKVVTLSATILTSFTSLILLTVILWEGGERWQASKFHRTGQWVDLGDPVTVNQPWEPYSDFKRSITTLGSLAFKNTRRLCLVLSVPFGYLVGFLASCLRRLASTRRSQSKADDETKGLPPPAISSERVIPDLKFYNLSNGSSKTNSIKTQGRPTHRSAAPADTSRLSAETARSDDEQADSRPQTPEAPSKPSHFGRFNNTVRRLKRNPASHKIIKSLQVSPYESNTLKTFEALTHRIVPEKGSGAVQDLSFSPDGKWLAASFANETTGVWEVSGKFTWNNGFPTQPGGIAWSPDSRYLLAKHKAQGAVIWSPNDGQKLSVSRKKFEAITWLSNGNFVAIHNQRVYIIAGNTGATESRLLLSSRRPLRMHDIASIPTGDPNRRGLIIAIGSVQDKPWNEEIYQRLLTFKFLAGPMPMRPEEVQPQRRILGKIAAAVPIWGKAQHVTVSRNGMFALISYAAPTPPELWEITPSAEENVSLRLCHMYLPTTGAAEGTTSLTEFVGQARFGGDADEYVVATTRSGEVYIWDAHSSELCHVIKDARDGAINSQVMGIGWCPTNKEMRVPMFACGLGEAEIVVWKGQGQDPAKHEKASPGPSRTQAMP
ncbi:hypothetical protein FRC05_004842 [Tulasnella sp. 425]|nr:hypothetical protein FRC05_004842 [Tulasnella sp. 425]